MHVRRARPADAAAIHAVHVAAVRARCRTHYDPAEIEGWVAATSPAQHAADVAGHEVVVADVDRRVVGFATLDARAGEVRALYVHPGAAPGTGRRLLAVIERLARLRGLAGLRLDATSNAVAFYVAAGWRRERAGLRTLAGGPIACVHMAKGLPSLALVVRDETADDVDAVAEVVRAAFGRGDEARLVGRLRRAGVLAPSLVAVLDGAVAGHVGFSPVEVDGAAGRVLGLAPLAVVPLYQGCGIGARLVEEGLARARDRGAAAAIVLGHGAYYPRFGFERAGRWGIRYRDPVPADAFLVAELVPGSLARAGGVARYRPEFDVP